MKANENLNMLGAYGAWAAGHIPDSPGSLSFRNAEWTDLAAWRDAARKKLRDLLAVPPIEPAPIVEVTDSYEYEGLAIEELEWSLPYGPTTQALLLKPKESSGQLPGILALHDHGGNKYFGKQKITRTKHPTHPLIYQHQRHYYGGAAWANEIARRGYVVLVHDVFPFASRRVLSEDLPEHVTERLMSPPLAIDEVRADDLAREPSGPGFDVGEDELEADIARYNAFAAAHENLVAKSLFSAGLTWPGVFLAEDTFALDYLCGRDDVDATRIGCGGLSGGGLRTDYLAGMDDRISCSVTAGFMTTWRDLCLNTCYTHTWMVYIPHLAALMDFPEILGLRAPAPSFVLGTTKDPLFTLAEAERAGTILEEVYRKAGAPDAFSMSIHDGHHKFDLAMQHEAFDWFDRWL